MASVVPDSSNAKPKKVALTLCSNNYLAQAASLAESLKRTSPEWTLILGLVDEVSSSVDYAALGFSELLPVEAVGIPDFEEIWRKYNIVELNTAVKPFYVAHLLERPNTAVVVYLDPDTEVYSSLDCVVDELHTGSILLTPHTLSPVPDDGHRPFESVFLRYGVFNLGFLAVRQTSGARSFLGWWKERTARHGFDRLEDGLFVDQLWMNMAPVFFEGVRVSRNTGLNMAYWNLHERRLERREDGTWWVNRVQPLIFFHFSALDMDRPDAIARHQDRYNLDEREDLRELFTGYIGRVRGNGYDHYRQIKCAYESRRDALREMAFREERAAALRAAPIAFVVGCFLRRMRNVLSRLWSGVESRLAVRGRDLT